MASSMAGYLQRAAGDLQGPCQDQAAGIVRINEHLGVPCESGPRVKRARIGRPYRPNPVYSRSLHLPPAISDSETTELPAEHPSKAASLPFPGLFPGARVRLRNLKFNSYLNLQEAVLVEYIEAFARWRVRIADGSEKLILSSNLEVVDKAAGATSKPSGCSAAVAEALAQDRAEARPGAGPRECAPSHAGHALEAEQAAGTTGPSVPPPAGPAATAIRAAPGDLAADQLLHRLRSLHEEIDRERTPGGGELLAKQLRECEVLLRGSPPEGTLEEALDAVEEQFQCKLHSARAAAERAFAACREHVARVCKAVLAKASSSTALRSYISMKRPETYAELRGRNQCRDELWLAARDVLEPAEAMQKGVVERNLQLESTEQSLLGIIRAANDRLLGMRGTAELLVKELADLLKEDREKADVLLSKARPQIDELAGFVQHVAEEVAKETAEGRDAHRQALESLLEEYARFVRMNANPMSNPFFVSNQEGIASTLRLQEDLERQEREVQEFVKRWAVLMAGAPRSHAEVAPPETQGWKRKWAWLWPWHMASLLR